MTFELENGSFQWMPLWHSCTQAGEHVNTVVRFIESKKKNAVGRESLSNLVNGHEILDTSWKVVSSFVLCAPCWHLLKPWR